MANAPVIITDGDKGGVGKSFVARAVAHCLVKWDANPVGVDGDARNAHLERFYGRSFPVERLYLREADGWNQLINLIEATAGERPVLVDLPGNIGDAVAEWGSKLKRALEILRRPLVRLWALDEEDDVIALLKASTAVFPFDAGTVAVMNGRFGKPANFELWNGSKTRAALLEGGGAEVYLPALAPKTRAKVRNAACAFGDAATAAGLTLAEAMDLEVWLPEVERAFEPLRAKLGA